MRGLSHTSHQRANLSGFFFAVLFSGALFSYMGGGLQLFGYAVALAGLTGVGLTVPMVSRPRVQFAVGCCLASVTVSIFSMIRASGYAVDPLTIMQTLAYPIIFAAFLTFGWRIEFCNLKFLYAVTAFFGVLNAAIAAAASLGYLHSFPIIGKIETGRYIFGTNIPSSTGLVYNLNYYSTVQCVIFLLYGWLLSSDQKQRRPFSFVFAIFLLVSMVIGSSRGAAIGLFASGLVLVILGAIAKSGGRRLAAFGVLVLVSIAGAYILAENWLFLEKIGRFSRGLNGRGAIWDSAIDVWQARPVLGYGFTGAGSNLLSSGLPGGGSLQSGYMLTLMRGGLVLFGLVYGSAIVILIFGMGASRVRWWRFRWPLAIVVFWLVNSAIRSFSLGGLGLLPVVTGVALSSILYAKYTDRISDPKSRIKDQQIAD